MKGSDRILPENRPPGLERHLGAFDSTMILMGIVIGSGIFLIPGMMAKELPSPVWILLTWGAGGLFTLAGAATYAELGAAFPEAGGQYVFLKEAYGSLAGFLFGWIAFWIYMTGGIAALAIGFSKYFQAICPALNLEAPLFSFSPPRSGGDWTLAVTGGQCLAVAVILLLSAAHYRGLVLGKRIQNGLTVLKVLFLVLFVLIGFASGLPKADWSLEPIPGPRFLSRFSLALVAVFWAFDGWNNVTFTAGEIRSPGRNLPRALIAGTVLVTVLYLLMNVVYFSYVPAGEAGRVLIAERTATLLLGQGAALGIAAVILVSILGSINGSILVGPRILYAMSRDGLFFESAGRINSRYHTPGRAILLQGLWSGILVLSGTFEQLVIFAMFVSVIFWIAGAAAVFTLRKKHPGLERPYRVWGYPVVPILFICAAAIVLVSTLLERPEESLVGICLALLGIPVYGFWRWRKKLGHHS